MQDKFQVHQIEQLYDCTSNTGLCVAEVGPTQVGSVGYIIKHTA